MSLWIRLCNHTYIHTYIPQGAKCMHVRLVGIIHHIPAHPGLDNAWMLRIDCLVHQSYVCASASSGVGCDRL